MLPSAVPRFWKVHDAFPFPVMEQSPLISGCPQETMNKQITIEGSKFFFITN